MAFNRRGGENAPILRPRHLASLSLSGENFATNGAPQRELKVYLQKRFHGYKEKLELTERVETFLLPYH